MGKAKKLFIKVVEFRFYNAPMNYGHLMVITLTPSWGVALLM